MDKKTKIFFWILIIATLVSVTLIFKRAFITKEYDIVHDESENIEL